MGFNKKRGFSFYDIEEYLKDAGATKVNEKALVSFEKELEEAVDDLVNGASVYANYAGRQKIIKYSDVELMKSCKPKNVLFFNKVKKNNRYHAKKRGLVYIKKASAQSAARTQVPQSLLQ
ncbi:MAG: hypothetical protein ACP5TL_02025 [Candidatus Micrarchaeia archaeon]